jgi:energy-coupling factor transporter ATP-binding protein EcfA2
MLQKAFFESRNYRELLYGTAYRFVVGRRGSGKSALFVKLAEALAEQHGVLLLKERPTEDKARALQAELTKLSSNYLETRIVTRLTWKIQVLSQVLESILTHYKAAKLENRSELVAYRGCHPTLFAEQGLARSLEALRVTLRTHSGIAVGALPEQLANDFQLNWLQQHVPAALQTLNRRVFYLYDGLDEGWAPTQVATGVLGGLAMAAVDFREAQGVHCLLFVRDNMFRALAELDGDYTRNIEGNTLRVHWDEESLLDLVALRLRVAFDWRGENSAKTWNRFAQRGLQGVDGFKQCLKLTLYRPRDVIALLNQAFQISCTHDREALIETDVEAGATRISQTRLSDLFKEYEQVLPGLPQFAQAFRGQRARMPCSEAVALLDAAVASVQAGPAARDMALLRTGTEAFDALYSVGFLGLQEPDNSVRFCHDGSNTDVTTVAAERPVVVHPCYWRALSVTAESPDDLDVRVDDEEDVTFSDAGKREVRDMRLRHLGRIVEELRSIPEGHAGAHAFEEWVFNTVRYLFSPGLDNVQWKPNPGDVQQRDIVGTVNGTRGFWARVARYDVSQFIIEVKNFQETDAAVFRQAWGYLKGPYGRCMMIVTRSEGDGITEKERLLVKEGYDSDPHKLVLLMPAHHLERALRKMRSNNEERAAYTERLLAKRLDTFERSYISHRASRHSAQG